MNTWTNQLYFGDKPQASSANTTFNPLLTERSGENSVAQITFFNETLGISLARSTDGA